MLQRWDSLLFAHITVDPEWIQAQLPEGLTVDTFEGKAYLGFVPFKMRRIRFPGTPSVPYISNFLETNIRTYVHRQGKKPGVWFFSLDCSRWLACLVARAQFHLPYYHSDLRFHQSGDEHSYSGRRLATLPLPSIWSGLSPNAGPHDYSIAPQIDISNLEVADQGTLDFFLLERYLLYSCNRSGELFTGRVWHEPYTFSKNVIEMAEPEDVRLLDTSTRKLGSGSGWDHLCFSPGVDVNIFSLSKMSRSI